MESLQIFKHTEFGELGVLLIDGKEHFPASECANKLGYKNPNKAIIDHCKGVTKRDTLSAGGIQEVNYIPEGDLYRLIVKSKLPAAERFEKWVFEEVLPSIRKHGMYVTPEVVDQILGDPDFGIRLLNEIKTERQLRIKLEVQIEEDKPKVILANSITDSDDCILVRELAKFLNQNGIKIGGNRLMDWLRNNGYLIKKEGSDRNQPTQSAMNMGLFKVKEGAYVNLDGSHITKTTKVTGKGQLYFINKFSNITAI